MDLHDLFENNRLHLLKKANMLIANLNRKLANTSQPLEEDQHKLESVLSIINELNSFDLVLEDHVNDIQSFVLDMVISLKERGLKSIPLSKLENELAKNGLETDKQFLIDFLSDIEGVQEVDPGNDKIIFNTNIDRGVSDEEAAEEKAAMKNIATKVAKDNIKRDNNGRKLEIK